MRDNALLSRAILRSDENRPDIYLSVLPLFHSVGQTIIQNRAMAFSGTIHMRTAPARSSSTTIVERSRGFTRSG